MLVRHFKNCRCLKWSKYFFIFFFFSMWLIFCVVLDLTLTALKIYPREILNSNLTFWTLPLIISFTVYCHIGLQQKSQDLSLSFCFGTWDLLNIINNHSSGNLLIRNNWLKVPKIWPYNDPQGRPQSIIWVVELLNSWPSPISIKISHCQNLVTALLNSRLFA